MASYPDVGDPAPLFSLPSTEGTVNLAERLEEGPVLLAVNHDDLATHEEFARKHKFLFPLCSDVDRRVSHAYGALLELWKMHRVLVLVGDDGRIWWRHRVLRAFYKNAADLEKVIRELGSSR